VTWLRADDALEDIHEQRERADERRREARLREIRANAVKTRKALDVLGAIDPYELSESDKRALASGEWIGPFVKSADLSVMSSAVENAAAELAARVRLMLEER